jgi:hypothetical protein
MTILRFLLLGILCRFVLVSSSNSRATSRSNNLGVGVILKPVRGGTSQPQTVSIKEDETTYPVQKNMPVLLERVVDNDGDACENRDKFPINMSSSVLPSNASLSSVVGEEDDESSSYDDDEAVSMKQAAKRRKRFLNRIARVSSLLLRREHDASLEEEAELEKQDSEWGNEITPQSDLTRPGRFVHIVTTAALPWFTGTAVNPLLRAAYLHERLQKINDNAANITNTKSSYVTLVIPWLELPEDQRQVYNGQVFQSPHEQETYVRNWLRNQAGMPNAADNLNLVFYNARYHAELGSVFAMGDIIQQLPQDELDVCVLEEPEQ